MAALAGKTALLTGALGTLGQAQARALADAGARLFLLDRPEMQNGESFAGEVATRGKVAATTSGQDLGDLAGSEAAIRKLAAEHGGIDILINNAALIINKPFEEFSLAEYEEQVRVNSSAAFALARAVAPAMKGKRYGKIVNFCSITLNGRWDGYVPYVASKGAMLGLTKSLARELGPLWHSRQRSVAGRCRVGGGEARLRRQARRVQSLGTREPMPEDTDHARGRRRAHPVPGLAGVGHDHRPEHFDRRRMVRGGLR